MKRELWTVLISLLLHLAFVSYLGLFSLVDEKADTLDFSVIQQREFPPLPTPMASQNVNTILKNIETNLHGDVEKEKRKIDPFKISKDLIETQAQKMARTESLEKWTEVAPSIQRVEKFLDEIVDYDPKFIQQSIEGTVTFEMDVNKAGEIVRIDYKGATGPDKLVGYVLGILVKNKSKLSCQMQNSKISLDILPLIVRVHYALYANEFEAQQRDHDRTHMNVINIYRYGIDPLVIQMTESKNGKTGHEEGVPQLNVDVLRVIGKLFSGNKKESESSRLSWDLKKKLQEAINECKNHEAEGACYFVGKTLLGFGESKLAVEYFNLSCQYGYALACEKIEEKIKPL